MAKEIICKRCGACCHYIAPDGSRKACRFLIWIRKDPPITTCRIYSARIGTLVGIAEHGPIYCCERADHGPEPGCPYNPL